MTGQPSETSIQKYRGPNGVVSAQYRKDSGRSQKGPSGVRNGRNITEGSTGKEATDERRRKKAYRRRRVNKKKVARACNHCRKAHITCDESRPCKKCIARHMADTCRDAPRKTKKYLLQDLQEGVRIPLPGVAEAVPFKDAARSISPSLLPPGRNLNITGQYRGPSAMNTTNSSSSSQDQSGNFLSSAADLEYSVLGSIISRDGRKDSDSSHSHSGTTTPTQRFSSPDDFGYLNYQPLMQQGQGQGQIQGQGQNQHSQLQPQQQPQVRHLFEQSGTESRAYGDFQHEEEPKCDPSTNQYFIGTISTMDGVRTYPFPDVVKSLAVFKARNPTEFRRRNRRSAISFAVSVLEQLPGDVFSNTVSRGNSYSALTDFHYVDGQSATKRQRIGSSDAVGSLSRAKSVPPLQPEDALGQQVSSPTSGNCGLLFREPSEIYSQIKTPFPYVRPYHDLNLYLRRRFDRQHLMSMSMSIAEYRPSFIAGMIHLKEDDLIFAEQCFQRTLLEYDNYISISGTPTLVWRRTSQIAYVGDEFCILTGWTKQELLGKSTFAVEIMDDKSCVEYFRLFSKISFGDFRGATMTECTLLTPKHESIRTSCVWTLKRDVFGIPMMIIANFLPILT